MLLRQTFAALTDDHRRHIIDLLKEREMNAGQIGTHLDITAPSLSHHLKILKNAGMISDRRHGQEIIYSLNVSVIKELSQTILKFLKYNKK